MRHIRPNPILSVLALAVLAACEDPRMTNDGRNFSPGHRQLAASLGLDPAQYSVGELALIRHLKASDGLRGHRFRSVLSR